jgi:hypothetical protein
MIDGATRTDVPGMEIGTQHKYAFNILLDFRPDESPMRPETAAILRQREADADPADVCGAPAGVPLGGLLSEPIKIVQSPKMTVILYESDNSHRQIYTDGRGLPREITFPTYLGYSVGRWERDTLIVDTIGFNDKHALDLIGHPHSDGLHVTERYRRRDFGHLDVELTFDDPRMYTRPFTIKVPHDLLPDADIFESFCENEKDRAHLGNK